MGEIQQMNKRFVVIPLAVAAAASIAFVAANSGANFSASKSGTITGSVATVSVYAAGGGGADNLDIAFGTPLVPGQDQSVTTTFGNNGTVAEDIYVVFNNPDALHAINQLGTFGNAHMSVDTSPEFFGSANLNDGLQNGASPAGPYFCSSPPPPPMGQLAVCPIPTTHLLVADVPVGATHTFTFTFGYADKLGSHAGMSVSSGGGLFNPYPVDSTGTVVAGLSVNNGLPYQFYAVPAGTTGPSITPTV